MVAPFCCDVGLRLTHPDRLRSCDDVWFRPCRNSRYLSAMLIWHLSRSRLSRVVIAGALLGSSISAMHFCGVLATQVTGTVHLEISEVGLSVAVAIALSIVALARFEGLPSNWRRVETTAWLSLAICGLHFTAMTRSQPRTRLARNSQAAIIGSDGLAIAIGSFSVAILIVSMAATIMEQRSLATRQYGTSADPDVERPQPGNPICMS